MTLLQFALLTALFAVVLGVWGYLCLSRLRREMDEALHDWVCSATDLLKAHGARLASLETDREEWRINQPADDPAHWTN